MLPNSVTRWPIIFVQFLAFTVIKTFAKYHIKFAKVQKFEILQTLTNTFKINGQSGGDIWQIKSHCFRGP